MKKRGIITWLQNEAKKLRPMTWKKRLEYFRMYYLVPVSITVVALFFTIWGITTIIINSGREDKLYIHLANSTLSSYDDWLAQYEQARGYTDEQYAVISQGQYAPGNEAFTYSASVYSVAKSLDVLICDDETLEPMLKMGLAQEVPPVLNADTAALTQDRIGSVDILKEATYGDETEQIKGAYYLDISGTIFAGTLDMDKAYLLISVNTPRLDEVNAFIQYVLTQE